MVPVTFNLRKILKALLFATPEPLTVKDIQQWVARYHEKANALPPGEEPGALFAQDIQEQMPSLLTSTQIRDLVEDINRELESNGEIFRVSEGANGFQWLLKPEWSPWVRLLHQDPKPLRLSPAALEVLAIIAYRQPVTRAEIEKVRGVASDYALQRLVENALVEEKGRADLPGRPVQFGTTLNFLDFVGIRSLEELPESDVLKPDELSAWLKQAQTAETMDELELGLPSDKTEPTPDLS